MGGETGTCLSGPACKAFDPVTKQPYRTDHPLCRACLDAAERDIRALVYDYLDLAQLHESSLSQVINGKVSGGAVESPTLIADHIDELQAEIVHALAVWEYELRVTCQLSDPGTFAPVWKTAVYDGINLIKRTPATYKARAGRTVQRAVDTITVRLEKLAALPPTVVCPTGVEDQPAEMHGWEAVHHLQYLHTRARATLGRTTRRFWIPGECWTCGTSPRQGVDGPLWRSEPQFADPDPEGRRDPMQVNCDQCGAARPYPDYETYMVTLLWPELEVAA